jgi:hypothetical protein
MLSVIYISCRDERPFANHPEWNQWEVLGRSLKAQTYRDWELVAVTPHIGHAATTFSGYVGGGTITPPRDTPWRRARTFCAASAINTGLIYARGDFCVVLGDCCEFEPDLLERISQYVARGLGTAIMVAGKLVDMRVGWFAEHQSGGVVHMARHGGQPFPQGLIAFPLEAALEVNGYDEHFDGGRGLEDVDFSLRLQQAGVSFVMDERCVVKMHPHLWAVDPAIIDEKEQVVRCCNPTWALARERRSPVANVVPYTQEQINRVLRCFMWVDGKCGYYGATVPCGYPFGEHGHPTARRIMVDEGEPTFSLREERAKVGL